MATLLNQVAECQRCGVALMRSTYGNGWTHARQRGRSQRHKPVPIPTNPGAYGIEAVPVGTPNAVSCGECGRSWAEDITPAGRCPWEHEHRH